MKELKTALYTKLHGDATLLATAVGDVHDMLAPDKTALPYVVYQVLGSDADWTLGARVSDEFTVQVKAVDEGLDSTDVETIKARLLALLNDQALAVAGKTTWLCRCAGEIPDYAEMAPNGRTLLHGGLRFRIVLA